MMNISLKAYFIWISIVLFEVIIAHFIWPTNTWHRTFFLFYYIAYLPLLLSILYVWGDVIRLLLIKLYKFFFNKK